MTWEQKEQLEQIIYWHEHEALKELKQSIEVIDDDTKEIVEMIDERMEEILSNN